MVEIPSVAPLTDRFAREVDFLSIGTNDLTRYSLPAERGNRWIAYLNDSCHLAVLKDIQQVIITAHHLAFGWVCAVKAGGLQAVSILLGLGVDESRMTSRQIPAVKRLARNWSLTGIQELALQVLEFDSAEDVRQATRAFTSSPD